LKKLLLLALLLTSCAPGVRYSLHENNDIFKPTENGDRDFSQGVRVAVEVPDSSGSTAYFIGQNFYTPDHKQLTELQPNDRPYSGYLYAGADFKYRKSPTLQNVFGITGGIVGPHSYAEQTQNTVHSWLGQQTAKGWDNQIGDEIGIILKAEQNEAHFLSEHFDWLTTLGAHAGNVFTQGYAGINFRAGYNLPDPFSSPGIVYPRGQYEEKRRLAYYLYGGPWLRAVAHNIFLDGNTFRDSHSVDKYPLVVEGRLGFAVEYGLYRFAYTYVFPTKEVHGAPAATDFGEITLSVGW